MTISNDDGKEICLVYLWSYAYFARTGLVAIIIQFQELYVNFLYNPVKKNIY